MLTDASPTTLLLLGLLAGIGVAVILTAGVVVILWRAGRRARGVGATVASATVPVHEPALDIEAAGRCLEAPRQGREE